MSVVIIMALTLAVAVLCAAGGYREGLKQVREKHARLLRE